MTFIWLENLGSLAPTARTFSPSTHQDIRENTRVPSLGMDHTDSTEPTAAPKKAPVAYTDPN